MMKPFESRIVCRNFSALPLSRSTLVPVLLTLAISLLTLGPGVGAIDLPKDLVAGPSPGLESMVVASGPLAREVGVDSYRVRRTGSQIVVDLLSSDQTIATLRKTCACGHQALEQRLAIEVGQSRLEVRSTEARQDWSLNGRSLTSLSHRSALSEETLQQMAISENNTPGVLQALQLLAAEPDLGLWAEDQRTDSGGLLSCPACPPVSVSTLWPKDLSEGEPSFEERVGLPGGFDCGKRGGWSCSFNWNVSTSERIMQNTRFECGGGLTIGGLFTVIPGVCGDWSHTQPESWVDVSGGISQACDDHSSSFHGPLGGEWNGCSIAYQQSTGVHSIESVNQGANYWPFSGNQNWSWDVPGCVSFVQPPPPPTVMIALGNYTVTPAFASIYDLDTCTFKQLAGTIYWDPFTVTAQRTVDQPFRKITEVVGSAPTQCATQVEACENALLCSDLIVRGVQVCTFNYDEPRTRCDPGCF